jgi:hypothetical protein
MERRSPWKREMTLLRSIFAPLAWWSIIVNALTAISNNFHQLHIEVETNLPFCSTASNACDGIPHAANLGYQGKTMKDLILWQ